MAFSVDFWEMAGYPREVATLDGVACVRKLRVAWADRHTLITEMFSNANNGYGYNGNYGYVKKVASEPLQLAQQSQGATADLATYAFAVVTVEYSTASIGVNSTGVVTESLDPAPRWWTVDHADLYWAGAPPTPARPGDAPRLCQPGFNYTRIEHGVTAVPAGVLTLQGYINSSAVATALLGVTFPAETLLYLGTKIHRQASTAGVTTFRLFHQLNYRYHGGHGWNYFYRPKTNAFEQITDIDGGVLTPYQTANLNTLFQT